VLFLCQSKLASRAASASALRDLAASSNRPASRHAVAVQHRLDQIIALKAAPFRVKRRSRTDWYSIPEATAANTLKPPVQMGIGATHNVP
jgi:hypothetical protein